MPNLSQPNPVANLMLPSILSSQKNAHTTLMAPEAVNTVNTLTDQFWPNFFLVWRRLARSALFKITEDSVLVSGSLVSLSAATRGSLKSEVAGKAIN